MLRSPGYVYHIKDSYFDKVKYNDPNKKTFLMNNKENGNYRPTYYCIEDKKIQI